MSGREGRAAIAAANNARWCDAVCRAHGCPCAFVPGAWINRGTPPPYYSNLVTLGGPGQAATHVRLINEHLASDPRPFGFKDSFACVDLGTVGRGRRVSVLFEASWIWREAGVATPPPGDALRWERVTTAQELAAFERAWRGEEANAAAEATLTQFPASLLEDDTITFLAGVSDGRRVEGVAIVNRTGEVAGLSNVFGARVAPGELWAGAVHAAAALHPECTLVGYERDEDLSHACRLGFAEVGRLRVVVIEGGVR